MKIEDVDSAVMDESFRLREILNEIGNLSYYNLFGLKLELVYMHSREVGLGVEVAELNWVTQIGRDNIFDAKNITTVRLLVPRVSKLFKELSIKAPVKIYHHIDLEGCLTSTPAASRSFDFYYHYDSPLYHSRRF